MRLLACLLSSACSLPAGRDPEGEPSQCPECPADDSGIDTDGTDPGTTDSGGPSDDTSQPGGIVGSYDLANADAVVLAPGTGTYAGNVLDAGDVTGDHVVDVLVANVLGGDTNGGAYLLTEAPAGEVMIGDVGTELASDEPTRGAGRSVGIGDVNGDAFLDIAIGAPWAKPRAGQFIVYGPVTADVDLATQYDVALTSQAEPTQNMCGHGSDLGDFDGDGVADTVVGANSDDTVAPNGGALFVQFGPLSGDVNLDVAADVEIFGENAESFPGRS